jgi:hypothetical protein
MKDFMKKFFLGVMISAFLLSCNNEKKDEVAKTADSTTEAPSTDKKAASELLDLSAGESVKQSFEAFAKGDIDGMTAGFDDNIRYTWSSGDSLIGKKAVADYYKGRLSLIDSVSVAEPIVLPIQVNESQSKYAPTGKWVLYWAMLNVKYKNGKKISFWMHNANHFNDAGKVDFVGQYIDRGQIAAASAGMKK